MSNIAMQFNCPEMEVETCIYYSDDDNEMTERYEVYFSWHNYVLTDAFIQRMQPAMVAEIKKISKWETGKVLYITLDNNHPSEITAEYSYDGDYLYDAELMIDTDGAVKSISAERFL
jgi:hypothetical protein